jgi:isopenicillin N synthase-like dioxygenase
MTGDFASARLTQPIVVNYHDLLDTSKGPDVLVMLEQALGKDGLGVIAVSNIPEYAKLRKALLPLASMLAQFPKQTQEKWEDAASSYNVGWSLGKESLADGSTDTKKGSFYANPLHDRPTDDEGLMKEYPSYARPNIWPDEDVPELEPAFKALGRVMYDVGMLLLTKCQELVDSLVILHCRAETGEQRSNGKQSSLDLSHTASESRCVKVCLFVCLNLCSTAL